MSRSRNTMKSRNFVAKAVAELGLRSASEHKAKSKYNRKQKHKKNIQDSAE
jgi:hypothetical protein